jgi:3D (Asp-Asp-Asp) domain-containing protein
MRRGHLFSALIVLLALVASACTVPGPGVKGPSGPPLPPTPLVAAALPPIADDLALDGVAKGAITSELYFARRASAPAEVFELGRDRYSRDDLRVSNAHVFNLVETLDPAEVPAALARDCIAYAANGGGRFTAYYEPVYVARRQRDERFRWPIYAMPADQRAQATRKEIDFEGALGGAGLELYWLADPVDVYFLHVQGSARLALGDGSTVRVGYAGNNGYKYESIGRWMLDRGLIEGSESSADGLKDWLRAHPERQAEVFAANPRYIFFRDLGPMGERGPVGAYGQSIVAGRSVAADPDYIPPGVLVYFETHAPQLDPDGNLTGLRPMRRLAFNHDKGGAIRGPGRVDIFWGTGARAGREAGFVSEAGRLYVLVCGAPAARTRTARAGGLPGGPAAVDRNGRAGDVARRR